MTTSALRPFRRQYSCACRTWRTSGHVVVTDDADEQDRQIAGNAVRPETGLTELVRRESCRRSREASRSVKSTREARRSNRSASSFEMPRWRRPLCACVNARANVRDAALGIVVLLGERLGGRAIRRDAGREAQPHGGARGQPDALAKADDRIEHDTGRARQGASVERLRVVRCRGRGRGSARDRFPIRPAPAAGLPGSRRAPPRRRAHRGSRGRRWQSSAALCGRYSVSRNSLPNAGWARSSAGDAEDDLRVAGDVDLADPRARG